MKIIEKNLEELIPYENNPRNNEDAVDAVAESIKEFGWQQPIVIDPDSVIVAGHTRYLAAKKLQLKTVPVVIATVQHTESTILRYGNGRCPCRVS